MVHLNVKGLVAPVFTPINSDQSVNYGVIPKYLEYLNLNRIAAVLVCGTSGEGTSFCVEERMKIAEAWINKAKKYDTKVIVQIGGAPLRDILKLAKHAESIKADGILTLPELYFKPKSEEQLVAYLMQISEAAPSLPILYYHFPMMSGVCVNTKKFFSIASAKIPNFEGMKADLGSVLDIDDLGGKTIFIGNHLLAPATLLGYDSSIATVTNMFPKLMTQIVETTKSSDFEKTKTLQEQINNLIKIISAYGDWVPSMKAAMEIITGIEMGPPRFPLEPLTKHQREKMEKDLINLNHVY